MSTFLMVLSFFASFAPAILLEARDQAKKRRSDFFDKNLIDELSQDAFNILGVAPGKVRLVNCIIEEARFIYSRNPKKDYKSYTLEAFSVLGRTGKFTRGSMVFKALGKWSLWRFKKKVLHI